MTDRIPPHKIDRSKAVEDRAKLLDVQERARAARPVDTGRDILKTPGAFNTF